MLHIFMVLYAVCRCTISANRLASFPGPFLSRPGNEASAIYIPFRNFHGIIFHEKCLPHKICVVLIVDMCMSDLAGNLIYNFFSSGVLLEFLNKLLQTACHNIR